MTLMLKTGLRPSAAQARLMAQHIGYQCWAYNQLLAALKVAIGELSDGARRSTTAALAQTLRLRRPAWTLELSQYPLDNARLHLERTLKRYWECRRGYHVHHKPGTCDFPTFHKRSRIGVLPGGGLDFKRKVFLSLRKRIGKWKIAHLPVAHRDRLPRFGFDRFEHFAQQHDCAITVVNQESLSPQEAMVADPMAIVPAFSCRLCGLRSYRKQIRDAVNHG